MCSACYTGPEEFSAWLVLLELCSPESKWRAKSRTAVTACILAWPLAHSSTMCADHFSKVDKVTKLDKADTRCTSSVCPCHAHSSTSLQDDQDDDADGQEEGRTRRQAAVPEFEEDGNTDLCVLCALGGSLLCCDGCPAAYHMRCIGETAKSIPQGEWLCPECSVGGRGQLPYLRSLQHLSHLDMGSYALQQALILSVKRN